MQGFYIGLRESSRAYFWRLKGALNNSACKLWRLGRIYTGIGMQRLQRRMFGLEVVGWRCGDEIPQTLQRLSVAGFSFWSVQRSTAST